MMKKIGLIFVSLVLLFSAVYAAELSSDYADGTLTISISGAEDLYGFQLNVNYNSAALAFDSAEPGALLTGGNPESVFYKTADTSTPGLLKNFAVSKMGKIPGESGNGVLLKVNFSELGEGEKGISISGIKLVNSSVEDSAPSVTPTTYGGTGGGGIDLMLILVIVVFLIVVAAAVYFFVIKK